MGPASSLGGDDSEVGSTGSGGDEVAARAGGGSEVLGDPLVGSGGDSEVPHGQVGEGGGSEVGMSAPPRARWSSDEAILGGLYGFVWEGGRRAGRFVRRTAAHALQGPSESEDT